MEPYCPKNRLPKSCEDMDSKSLYVLFSYSLSDRFGDRLPNWYRIDKPFEGGEVKEEVTELVPEKFGQKLGFGIVACGSKIYSFGGSEKRSMGGYEGKDDIWIYDTKSPNPSWIKQVVPMPRIRSDPVPVAVGNKIYVFGSSLYGTPKPVPWSEVFDPASGRWEALSGVPPKIVIEDGLLSGFAVNQEDKVIFMSSGRDLYLYDVNGPQSKSLKKATRKYRSFPPLYEGSAIIVDGICYMYASAGMIDVYDLKSKEQGFIDLSGEIMTPYMWDHSTIGSVHDLGSGKLCVVCTGCCTPEFMEGYNFLICAAFRVSREKSIDGELNLHASDISLRSYLLQGEFMEYSAAL